LGYYNRTVAQSSRYRAPFAPGGSATIDPAIAARLLSVALSEGGDRADLFFEYDVSGSYSLEEGILKSAGRSVSLGLGVRVLKGDATGYAYVQELEYDAMERAAKTAAQIASGGRAVAPVGLRRPELPVRYAPRALSLDVAGEHKRELLLRADRAARAADPRVIRVEASLAENLREILIATSDGKLVSDSQPMIRFSLRVIVEKNGKRQAGSSGGGGRTDLSYFDSRTPEWHAQEAVRQAVAMLDAVESPAGEMTVVLGPGDSGILLHEAVGHGLEADFNRKGTSNYSGRVGEKVASELCTVVDDATLIDGRGTINVDDEGNPPGRAVLIEQGRLAGYMHDQHSAQHFGTAITGNGRRESYQAHPMPRMTNTLLLAGPHDPEEILRSVKRGVYASRFGGGQVDISNGDFVFSLTEGYLIEDGKLTAPLKGVNLIGNGPEVMGKVDMLGNDVQVSDGIWTCGKDGQSVPVGVGCPTIRIDGMTVGGTQTG
jgi:TldD protein